MKYLLLVILIAGLMSGCAETQNVSACIQGHVYGFWGGLWHGIIAHVSFICSLFKDNVSVWAVNNNGGWYSFGFVLGIGGITSGSSKAASKK